MHGRLEDSQRKHVLSNDWERRVPALMVIVEGDGATLDHIRELVAQQPSIIAFVVRRERADAHQPIIASLKASGAVFGGAPVDGELIRAGYFYLLDEDIALGRCAGRFVIDQRYGRQRSENVRGQPCFERLTLRQREVLQMVVAGEASKRIAASLRISQRTVENHRAAIMRRLGARTLADLVRITVSS